MLTVGIYISIDGVAKRIELFNDEKISVTSSIQNIADISKIYTDFSQSFTVPATKNNNAIFSHWYDNSLVNGYDARRRKNAYIELDTIPFRNGKIQLESASMKNGKPENYTITFFGNLVSLKDTFRGLSLRDVDYSEFNFIYNGTYVKDRVSAQTTSDIKFPLISSLRPWQYGDASVNDITVTANAIVYTELFPALRLSKVFKGISDFYDVTFEGDFLDTDNFKNAYLWLKNGDVFTLPAARNILDFDAKSSPNGYDVNFDLLTDTFVFGGLFGTEIIDTSKITLECSANGVNGTLYIYAFGVQVEAIPFVSQIPPLDIPIDLTPYGSSSFQFYIEIDSALTIDFSFDFAISDGGFVTKSLLASVTTPKAFNSGSAVSNLMPDIKVEDFFSGILKMFNLTCYSTDGTTYNIRQIESWYESGDIIDLTQYIFKESATIDRVKSYKRVNFEYQKSENLISVAYLSNNGLEYGNLAQDFDADGEEYSVNLPFENLMFSNLSTTLQVGYTLKTDLKPYIPKPIILYDYGVLQSAGASGFKFNDGTSNFNLTDYNAFGADTNISGPIYSLNFGVEQSVLDNSLITDTLYFDYYQNYLANIFTSKARQIKIKGKLPLSILTSLQLNDRVIMQGKRYLINSFTTDLTTGEVDFDLLNDFRTL
jgi:hypothetical protein